MNEHDGWRQSPPGATAQSVKDLAHRLVILGELQGELLKVDLHDAIRGVVPAAGMLLGGAVFGLCSVPFSLLTITFALYEWAGLSWTLSAFIAMAVGFAVAGGCFLAGWKMLQKELDVFQRSRQEFRTNLTWLKEALRQQQPEDSECESVL